MPIAVDNVYVLAIAELLLVLLHLAVIGGVLAVRRRDPSATMAWILFVALAPVVGAVTYLVWGRSRVRHAARRSRIADAHLKEVLSHFDVRSQWTTPAALERDARTATQITLGNAMASTPASSGNSVRVLAGAAETYRELAEAIDAAADHVHVEFFIFQPDEVGSALRDRLVARAAAGVQVRVLCDAIGSRGLPSSFWKPLHDAGGVAAYFRPIWKLMPRMRRRDRVDLRNHRKIVVVDGRTAFTGGINVGREYLGLDPKIGHWRDTHIRVDGPAALSLQETFLHDWSMATGDNVDHARFFPCCPMNGTEVVQVIDSGPDDYWSAMELYIAQAIASAHQRVWITNPYFIPSPALEATLVASGLRGVDVRLLLPARSDSLIVAAASRSYYEELLSAGVRIFEYQRGFVHAKTMVVDDWMATVGSANMDMRSFNLNFELNAFVFGHSLCDELADHFEADMERAHEVDLASVTATGLPRRLARGMARLLSPLL
jgi:cardiolipin synthase